MAVPSQKEKVQANLAARAAQTATTSAELPDSEKPFKQIVREAFAAGKTRAQISKEHGVTYQRVFAITKGMEGVETKARPRAVLEDGTLRVDAIRKLFDEGSTVGEIAKALSTSYQIVYQATKKQRAALKGDEGVAEVEATGDEVEDETEEESDEDEEEIEDEPEG